MGLLDSILGVFNPDVISKYNNIVNNHPEAFRRWKGRQIVGTLSQYFDFEPTYSDKSYIASHEKEILAFETIIAEEKAFEKRRQEVIRAASVYPHAFAALLNKLSIPSVPGITATLPGQRKSKRAQRLERERRDSNLNLYNFNPSPILSDFERYYFNVNKESRSITTLTKEEYEKLYGKLNSLASEETHIKSELQKEDMLIRFEDEILDIEVRAKYYQSFCKSRFITESEEKKKIYCVEHLAEFDSYANTEIDSVYDSLKRKYPLGLNAFENIYKSMARLQIIDHENDIKICEDNYRQVERQYEWENAQKAFTQESRNLNNLLTNFGCYVYDIPFKKLTYDGNMVPATYRVWQHFCESYCDVEDLDYSYYPSVRKNYNKLAEFKAKTRYFYDKVYDKIIGFVEAIKQRYENIVVVIGDSALKDDSADFNNYHFSHLKKSLAEKNIEVFPVKDLIHQSAQFSYIIIIELISTNDGLITTCKELLDLYKKNCPKITYISLCKGYSKSEMTKLITEEKRKKEQIERAKREEEERKEHERLEKIRKEEERHRLVQNLQKAVRNWDSICGVIKYTYLFNYYPTTCDFEATESEWNNRWLVWNFKNTPGKTSNSDHTEALNNIVPRLKELLVNTFGLHNLKELVLVCIPASSQQKTSLRYQEFSQMLCTETGMISAYDKMTVTGERIAKHLGGTSNSMNGIDFDTNFFKDKVVILFDDIITKGNSMLSFKRKMEELGATVIGGFSIGKTTHMR